MRTIGITTLLLGCAERQRDPADPDPQVVAELWQGAQPPQTGDLDGDGFLVSDGDCDDLNPDTHPGAQDLCDGVDRDCDGQVDEDGEGEPYYLDSDGDGYGDATQVVWSCSGGSGLVDDDRDCDDSDSLVNPGQLENLDNTIDDDCDGQAPERDVVKVDPVLRSASEFQRATADTTKLRMLVVEQAGEGGEIAVTVGLLSPTVLVLVSHEQTHWIVAEDAAGTLQEVVVVGPSPATTATVPGTAALTMWLGDDVDLGHADFDQAPNRPLIAAAEQHTGLRLASFHGTPLESGLRLDPGGTWPDVSAYPDCDVDLPVALGPADRDLSFDGASCDGLAPAEPVCLLHSSRDLRAYGITSKVDCDLSGSLADASSLAWLDDSVYGCDPDTGLLQRVSLRDQTVQKAWVYCAAVAAWDGGLLVFTSALEPTLEPETAYLYTAFSDLSCNLPASTLGPMRVEMATVAGNRLYRTPSDSGTVDVHSLPDLALIGSLQLDILGDDIQSLAATDDGQLVVGLDLNDNNLRLYDASTGAAAPARTIGTGTTGITCAGP